MDRDLLDSLRKSGLPLLMLLLFYALFFADLKQAPDETVYFTHGNSTAGADCGETQEWPEMGLELLVGEQIKNTVPQSTVCPKIQEACSVVPRMTGRYGSSGDVTRICSDRNVRRIVLMMVLFLFRSDLWKGVSGSFYHCIQEHHSDILSLYSNPIRRGPPQRIITVM